MTNVEELGTGGPPSASVSLLCWLDRSRALTAVIWWYGMNLTRLLDVASDGVVATPDHLHFRPQFRFCCWALMARAGGL